MAAESSRNKKYTAASEGYKEAKDKYTGNTGYTNSVLQGMGTGAKETQLANAQGIDFGKRTNYAATDAGYKGARSQTEASTNNAINKGAQMNAAQNAEAQKYAGQQASAAAAGAQSQATTAARAAGMNKAAAAMMGSQQNANAFQNAYGNAYGQQLGNAASNQNTQLANYNNAFENNANRMNSNINNSQQMANANQQFQQQMAMQSGLANLNASGTQLSAGQQEGQNEYNRGMGNNAYVWGLLTSDEKLKHYRECSKKVVTRTPSKIQTLKYVHKGE